MELLPKTDPLFVPPPVVSVGVQIYADGHATLHGIPNDSKILLEIIRLLSQEHLKAAAAAMRPGGIVLPVAPIRRGPLNGH